MGCTSRRKRLQRPTSAVVLGERGVPGLFGVAACFFFALESLAADTAL
jgi:hypothetical protein